MWLLNVDGTTGVRPAKWLCKRAIEVVDKTEQAILQFLERSETSACNGPAMNDPKYHLDLIHP